MAAITPSVKLPALKSEMAPSPMFGDEQNDCFDTILFYNLDTFLLPQVNFATFYFIDSELEYSLNKYLFPLILIIHAIM